MDEIKERFERKHGASVLTNYAATSALVQQITSQAEADVLLSANTLWADHLDDQGFLVSRRDLLSNSLVIVVPEDSAVSLERPEDLLSEKIRHIALADPEGAPAGIYAKQALEKLGLWAKLEGKMAPAADVRRALSFVETRAAEAGLVYRTDAAGSRSVRVAIELDPKLSDPIRYPVALLKSASDKPSARLLYDYLASAEAAEVFREHGFGVDFEPSE
jgi:molybdate transport system substrate-binding protein